jgi:hypothetical protein
MWRWQARYLGEGMAGFKRDKTRPSRVPPLRREERLKVIKMTVQEGSRRLRFQFVDAGIAAPGYPLRRDLDEEPFDQVQPGRAGRCEMQLEARVFAQPRRSALQHFIDAQRQRHKLPRWRHIERRVREEAGDIYLQKL